MGPPAFKRPLAIVRPEPGAAATLAAAQALELDAHACPIFAVAPLAWKPVARDAVDALLLGSANAVRHGGPALAALRGLPAYCVGQTTAAVARQAGFTIAGVGTGGLQTVLDAVPPEHRRLLRLAGVSRVDLSPPPGIIVETREVYAAMPLPMPPRLAELLRQAAVVMLHSADAARHFATLCEDAGIDRGAIGLAVIGPRAVAPAGTGWREIAVAQKPSDAALLALACKLCQDAAQSAESAR